MKEQRIEPGAPTATRYIALNPVAAGPVRRAEDWPWSSARAHLAGADDEPATVARLRALIPDFAALLTAPGDPATTAWSERAPTIGRPLGAPEWIAALKRSSAGAWPPANRAQSPGWTGTPKRQLPLL